MNALMFYGLMSMGLCVGLIALLLGQTALIIRCGVAVLTGVGLYGLYSILMLYNPAHVLWPGDMRITGALTIGLMAFGAGLRPAVFDTHRAAKLTLLALIVPGVSYGIEVMMA